MKILVLGLGNPILSDDGVGFQVARELKTKLDQGDIVVEETSMAGLNLLDTLVNFDRAIIIDAIHTVGGKVGRIYQLEPKALDTTRHTGATHDVSFATALDLGKRLGLSLPQQITIFAIEAEDTRSFSENCTPKVKKTIPVCVEMIIQKLKGWRDA